MAVTSPAMMTVELVRPGHNNGKAGHNDRLSASLTQGLWIPGPSLRDAPE
jgi:hypothetical protein